MPIIKKKIIFVSTLPRGGGSSIIKLNLIKKNTNIFLWPYEFFYSNLYNEAFAKNKNIDQINNFFLKKSFNKFFDFLKKKEIKNFNKEVFLKYLNNFKMSLTKQNYLEHVIFSMIKASKFHNYDKITHIFILTTIRGMIWDKSIENSNYFFVATNRKILDSFKSIRSRTINSSGFDNFFSLKGKKSFYYWIENYEKLVDLKKKKLNKKIILCFFENINYDLSKKELIKNKNQDILKHQLQINTDKEDIIELNNFYEIFKKKKTLNITILPIERFLLERKIRKRKINSFFLLFFKSIKIYKTILLTKKKNNINLSLLKFIYNFFKYYLLLKLAPHYYKKIILFNNKHLKYTDYWEN